MPSPPVPNVAPQVQRGLGILYAHAGLPGGPGVPGGLTPVQSVDVGQAVVDLSPGSGRLATTCVKLGIPYCGMVSHQTHLAWLGGVLDREALKQIITPGTAMFTSSDRSRCRSR